MNAPTKQVVLIAPEHLAPINLGLMAVSMTLDRIARHPEQLADATTDIRDTVNELRAYVRTLQGRTA